MIKILNAKISPLPKHGGQLQWASLSVDLGKNHRHLSPIYPQSKVALFCENTPSYQTLVFEASPCDEQGRIQSLRTPKTIVHPDSVKGILSQLSPKEESFHLLDHKIRWVQTLKAKAHTDAFQRLSQTGARGVPEPELQQEMQAQLLKQMSPVTRSLLMKNPHLNWNPDKTAWMPDFIGVLAKFKELLMLCESN